MDHFYKSIHGCFSFAEFYGWIASQAGEAWHGVEVGALEGQSAAYLAVELTKGIGIRLDLVEREHSNCAAIERNLVSVRSVIGAIYATSSVAASEHYAAGQLDFVMLDAGHEYSDLRSDIDAWWPKVKPNGGILATHDFCHYFPGLCKAWCESFPKFNVWVGSVWPEDDDARPEARQDFRNRSAKHEDRDVLPVAWVRK